MNSILTFDSEIPVTRFDSQKLLGYRIDENGFVTARVFEGVAVFSDGSERTIYGIYYEDTTSIIWNFAKEQEEPSVDRTSFGLKVEK